MPLKKGKCLVGVVGVSPYLNNLVSNVVNVEATRHFRDLLEMEPILANECPHDACMIRLQIETHLDNVWV